MGIMERTFVIIKPEGIKRKLVGEIIQRYERKGLFIVACKMLIPSQETVEKHYEELRSKPFFNGLVSHMTSGIVMAMVLEGKNVVETVRKINGATAPNAADVGTIRYDFACDVAKNIVHGSDSVENAAKELENWFGKVDKVELTGLES